MSFKGIERALIGGIKAKKPKMKWKRLVISNFNSLDSHIPIEIGDEPLLDTMINRNSFKISNI